MRILIAGAGLVLAAALSACGGLQVPKEIAVPMPVTCIKPDDVPQRPVLRSDDELLALDGYRFTHALWAAYQRLKGYAGQLEPIAQGCSEIPELPRPPP